MADTKRCGRCAEEKPLSAFSSARNRKDGLYGFCRTCAATQARASYARHREKRLAKANEYRLRPEVIAHRAEYNKAIYQATREAQLAAAKQWAKDNRQRRREYVRKWNNENREDVRSYQRNYKYKKRATGRAAVSAKAWNYVKATFRNRCVYCGGEAERLEQDHVVPISRGGLHLMDNVVPACRHCNATKLNNDAPPFWWAANA